MKKSILFFPLLILLLLQVIIQAQQPSTQYSGYYTVLKKNIQSTYISCELLYVGSQTSYITPDNLIVQNLIFNLTFDGNNELGFKIQSRDSEMFSLPYQIPFPFNKQSSSGQQQYIVEMANNLEQFYLNIIRIDTGEVIFQVDQEDQLIYTLYYYEITSKVQNEKLYGFGERRQHILYESGSYTIYNKDQYCQNEGGQPDNQLYGSHPMWLRKGLQNKYHVGFIRNANGMLLNYQQNKQMTFQMTGGVMEFKFFIGNQPEEAIKAYHNYINGFTLQPFWSMGFHICRWGLANSDEWKQVWLDAIANNVNLDTLWNDIDYMLNKEDFTIDTKNFNTTDMKQVADLTSPNGVHWIPIIDAGIYINGVSGIEGERQQVYIKSTTYEQSLQGCVWPGNSYFVDFNNPKSFAFWEQGLRNISLPPYNAPVPSGFWIDMNEYSNFVAGEIAPGTICSSSEELYNISKRKLQIEQSLKKQPYQSSSVENDGEYPWSPMGPTHPFNEKSLSQNATHYNGSDSQFIQTQSIQIQEFNFHSMNGFLEGIATNQALKNMGSSMPFIISRSTMFGSGAYVQHWTGDNYASWDFLQLSIAEIMNFQFYAIPMVGADICGFAGDTNPELCARWLQLGSFYPFSRDHNAIDAKDQYPWSFPDYPYVLDSSRASIQLRYSLLKFYYHQFVKLNGAGTIFKPLFFEFVDDNVDDLDSEFMIGKELLIAPVIRQGNSVTNKTTHTIYIPDNSIFYDFYTGLIQSSGYSIVQQPFNSTPPIFIRGGYIVHQQRNQFNRTRYADNHFYLLIALDNNNEAQGTILQIDDYSNEQVFLQQCVGNINCLLNINASVQTQEQQQNNIQLTIAISKSDQSTQFTNPGINIDGAIIYGVSGSSIEYKFDNTWNILQEETKTFIINF